MAAKKSTKTSAKKSSTKKSSAASNKRKSSTAPKKKSSVSKAAEQREIMRNRLIKAIICFLVGVVLLLIHFISGEILWNDLHKLYRGIFGMFGFFIPFILFYAAYQNARDESSDDYHNKLIMFPLLVFLLSTCVYSFGFTPDENGNYFTMVHDSFKAAAEGHGTGFIGAVIGIPAASLLGSVGAGILTLVTCIFVLVLASDTLIGYIFKALKKPVRRVEQHVEDERIIRNEVRRRKQELHEAEHEEKREKYIKEQIEKRSPKKKNGNPDYNSFRRSSFYEPEQSAAVNAEPVPQPEPTRKRKPKPDPVVEKAPEPVVPEVDENYNEGIDIDISAMSSMPAPAATAVHPEPAESEMTEIQSIYTPKPSKKNKNDPVEPLEVPESQIVVGSYIRPPFNLLEPQPAEQEANISMELNHSATMLVDTLKSFGVQTSIVNISRGPAITRYELQPAAGVKISKITNLSDDIAMNLAATGVRIEAPIPGKSAVGIEVPNKNVSIVKMRSLVESREFQNAKSKLTVALGKDISGNITLADLGKMPHLLIAGSTGSGKSVCVNSMLVSLLYKSSPDEVKLMLIDPKVVELGVYNGIPHLLVPVVTDPRKAAGALSWAVNEMLNRYKTFAEYNVRDMHSYNRFVDKQNAEIDENMIEAENEDEDRSYEEDEMLAQARSELENESRPEPEPKKLQKMAQIVIVIDELADLMMAAPNEVEESICRLAQMARAAGMHLVIATQRPSVDVITGLIKANIPSRIAFAVKSQIDSRTILDMGGAEKLVGRGDMLFSPIGTTKPIRVQGCLVDDREIEGIIDFIKKNKAVEYDTDVLEEIERNALPDNSKGSVDDSDGELDPMMEEAIRCVVEAGQASTSMLQRRFRVGYARAGRLIDEMEQMGIVGPHEGSKPRQVLMTYQQFLERSTQKTDEG